MPTKTPRDKNATSGVAGRTEFDTGPAWGVEQPVEIYREVSHRIAAPLARFDYTVDDLHVCILSRLMTMLSDR